MLALFTLDGGPLGRLRIEERFVRCRSSSQRSLAFPGLVRRTDRRLKFSHSLSLRMTAGVYAIRASGWWPPSRLRRILEHGTDQLASPDPGSGRARHHRDRPLAVRCRRRRGTIAATGGARIRASVRVRRSRGRREQCRSRAYGVGVARSTWCPLPQTARNPGSMRTPIPPAPLHQDLSDLKIGRSFPTGQEHNFSVLPDQLTSIEQEFCKRDAELFCPHRTRARADRGGLASADGAHRGAIDGGIGGTSGR